MKIYTQTRFNLLFALVMLMSSSADGQSLSLDTLKELPSVLPTEKNSFIERADAGERASGFKIRGIKGLAWTPNQYLKEIPVLASYKMNFMMNCYLSLFTRPKGAEYEWRPWGQLKNEWWLPLPEVVKADYEMIFKEAKKNGITFCFAVHPQLFSARPADLKSEKDFEALYQHYAWAQSKGIEWFSVSIDDIKLEKDVSPETYGRDQAMFVNRLFKRLRKKNKNVKMIFCPTHYSGLGTDPKEKAYLQTIGQILEKDVYVFWTGPQVVSQYITSGDALIFKNLVRHKLFLWDNYPVNDNETNTAHLAPISGRDKNLHTVIDGYLSNSMGLQSEINRIPLFTIADYAFNPESYDPSVSIGQSIIHQTEKKENQKLLYALTHLYASKMDVGFNPVVNHFNRISKSPFSSSLAEQYIHQVKSLQAELIRMYPSGYSGMKTTLSQTIDILTNNFKKQYGRSL